MVRHLLLIPGLDPMLVLCMGRVSRTLVIMDLRRRRSTETRYVEMVDGYRCTVLCAEGYSTDSSTSEASSSFVVECAERGAILPMKYINPMIQIEYVFGQNVAFQLLDGYSVEW